MARLRGAPLLTQDVDISPSLSPRNLERLTAALSELQARLRTSDKPDGVPFPFDPLQSANVWTLTCAVPILFVARSCRSGLGARRPLRVEAVFGLDAGREWGVASITSHKEPIWQTHTSQARSTTPASG